MKISAVTLSGFDDTTELDDVIELAQSNPFCRFGVLFDLRFEGTPAVPSRKARQQLEQLATSRSIPLVAQLAGQYLENILTGATALLHDLPSCYKAVQLNFGTYSGGFVDWPSVEDIVKAHPRFQFIIQYTGFEQNLPLTIRKLKNIALLLDHSCGRGQLPHVWPDPIEGINCGYAGGLAPENVSEQLLFLAEIVDHRCVFIDVLSGIRSGENGFDKARALALLQASRPYTA